MEHIKTPLARIKGISTVGDEWSKTEADIINILANSKCTVMMAGIILDDIKDHLLPLNTTVQEVI